MRGKYVIAILLVLTASILPDVLLPSPFTPIVKIIVLAVATTVFLLMENLKNFYKFSVALIMINTSLVLTYTIRNTALWKGLFCQASFFTNIESTVALKLIGILPVIAILFVLQRTPDSFYLRLGDLSAKAGSITWLGIEEDKIRWGKLSLISGFLIALGTFLLTLITSTGLRIPKEVGWLLPNLPIILLLAFVNSFCEGLIYRNAIMGPLKNQFSKAFVVLMSALFFGIAHYQGIPGGILGAVMSGLLGWFMARSMYETQGFASAWIIHFMQDVVIFSTLVVLS